MTIAQSDEVRVCCDWQSRGQDKSDDDYGGDDDEEEDIYKSGKYSMIITTIIRSVISSRSIKAQIEIYGCTHNANFLKTPTNSHLDFHSDSKFRRLV